MNEPTATHTNGVAPKAVSSSAGPEAVEVDVKSAPSAIDVIDRELRDNFELDALQRGVLVANRETLYITLSGAKSLADFVRHTSNKTGISRAVIQRLRRIGRLPAGVRLQLAGTKIADRQDLLVQLSDKVGGMLPAEALDVTADLIANPPARGPRAKAKPEQAAEQPSEAGPPPGTIPFTFGGDRLDVVRLADGDVGVVLKRLCEVVGIGFSSQLKRLNRTEALGARWAGVVTMTTTAADQKAYEMVVLPRRSIPMWAATLDASRCAPNALPKLVAFQDKAADVLAAAFLPNNTPLAERIDAAIALQIQSNGDLLLRLERRLAALEHNGFGSRPMLLVPQIAPEESGYSMESMNKYLGEKGYNISPSDTAIRSIAAKMKLIGDTTYGFWNAHNDGVGRGSALSESWRFNDTGTQALQEHAVVFCELKAKHEAAGEPAPRETALKETLDKVSAIGNGTYELLTRTRAGRRPPFPTIRGPENNG